MQSNKIWFKRKRYGWGWVPYSWEGWAVLFVYIVILIYFFQSIDAIQYSGSGMLINIALPIIILSVILIFICYKKGEKPKWSWGDK